MRTNEEIEDLLIGTGLPFERLDDAMWVVVNDADRGENLVVYKTAALVAFRMKVFELPASRPRGFCDASSSSMRPRWFTARMVSKAARSSWSTRSRPRTWMRTSWSR